jgi:hypothetical protein
MCPARVGQIGEAKILRFAQNDILEGVWTVRVYAIRRGATSSPYGTGPGTTWSV